jgi:hypothetical protein
MTPLHKPRLCFELPVCAARVQWENYLAQAIQCVLSQVFTHFRFIIFDNASSDSMFGVRKPIAPMV